MMALVLAVVMMLAMSATVFAADSVTISVDNSGANDENAAKQTYEAYKIFDVVKSASVEDPVTTDDTIGKTVGENNKGFAYTITKGSEWYSAVAALTDYFTLTEVKDGKTGDAVIYNVALKSGVTANEATAIAIAKELEKSISGKTKTTITAEQAATVDAGYYLITSDLGTNLILATTNITITEKNEYPSVDKEVAEDDQVAEIGQDVTFTVSIKVPKGAKAELKLTDTMSEGLTFKEFVSVKSGDADVAYTPANADATHQTFTVTFAADTIKTLAADAEKTIVVTYKATVNEKAKVSALNDSETGGDADDNTNTAKIDYSNYSQTDIADVNTVSFTLTKYDGSDSAKKPIAGAKFSLLNADKEVISLYEVKAGEEYRIATAAEKTAGTNIVTELTTVAEKTVVFKGVDSDLTYYLRETEAPAGYNKLDADVEVKPANDLSTSKEVANNQGSVLPSTGGIGTTIFYLIGAVLVIGAGVLLVTRRRMNANR